MNSFCNTVFVIVMQIKLVVVVVVVVVVSITRLFKSWEKRKLHFSRWYCCVAKCICV